MTSESRPESITGGCLCGAIRYTIHFPPGADWPPSHNATCQCTQCRKATGALVPQLIGVPAANVSPRLSPASAAPSGSLPTYRLYRSSPRAARGFCAVCGASLTWTTDDEPGQVELHVGTLDEDVLVGRFVEIAGQGDEYGPTVRKRTGGWARELAVPHEHNFVENAAAGVTDKAAGPKHLTVGTAGKKSFEGDLASIGRA